LDNLSQIKGSFDSFGGCAGQLLQVISLSGVHPESASKQACAYGKLWGNRRSSYPLIVAAKKTRCIMFDSCTVLHLIFHL